MITPGFIAPEIPTSYHRQRRCKSRWLPAHHVTCEALNKTASPASLCIPQSVPEFASGEPAHESKVFERRLPACEVWSYGVPYVAMSNQAPYAQCLHRFGSDLSGYSNFWCVSSGASLAVCRPRSRTAAEKRPAMPIGPLRCGDFGRTW